MKLSFIIVLLALVLDIASGQRGPPPRGGRHQQRRGPPGPPQGQRGPQRPPQQQNGQPGHDQDPNHHHQGPPPPPPYQPGTIIELGMHGNLFNHVIDQRLRLREDNIILIFTNSTCQKSKEGAQEFTKLAKGLGDSIKVARADCSFDTEACDFFVNHLKSSNGTYPYILMVGEKKSFVYDGPIDAEQIYNNFVLEKRYEQFKIHGSEHGIYSFGDMIKDGEQLVRSKQELEEKKQWEKQPYVIDQWFAYFFAEAIGFTFYHLGLGFWNKQSKVFTFIIVFLIPIWVFLYNWAIGYFETDKKTKKE